MKTSFYNYCLLLVSTILLWSCEEKYEILEGVSDIYITSESGNNRPLIGSEIVLNIYTNNGTDVTEECDIYVNDELLDSNTFSSNEVGTFTIIAVYQNLEANYQVEFHDGSDQVFKKRVLIEDYTGTWCGWCPRVSHAMKLVAEQTDKVVFSAIHRAPTGTGDPYNFTEAQSLEQLINTPGYPKGFINRMTQWEFPEPDNTAQVLAFTQGERPELDFAVTSEIVAENMLQAKINVLFTNAHDNIKLVVYLQENGLVYPQVNYTAHYDGENPIENYVHNYTLRATLTDILGEEIPSEEALPGTIYSRNFNFEIPEVVEDINQLDIVAFVIDANNEVINVRKSKIGETQEFVFD
ncbi:MAG: Omp28-related outer membrane protein [Bacteroidota bacterium]